MEITPSASDFAHLSRDLMADARGAADTPDRGRARRRRRRGVRVRQRVAAPPPGPRRDHGLDLRAGLGVRRPPVRARGGPVPGSRLGRRQLPRRGHRPRRTLAEVGTTRGQAGRGVGAQRPAVDRDRDDRRPEPLRREAAGLHRRRRRPRADLHRARHQRAQQRAAGQRSPDRRAQPAPDRRRAGHLDGDLRPHHGPVVRAACGATRARPTPSSATWPSMSSTAAACRATATLRRPSRPSRPRRQSESTCRRRGSRACRSAARAAFIPAAPCTPPPG